MYKVIFVFVVIFIIYSYQDMQYQVVKKYYPNMTYTEYLILHDKIKITPDWERERG